MFNIVQRRYLYFAISLIVIIPGTIAFAVWGLPTGIDFTGGSFLKVSFESGNRPSTEEVVRLFNDYGYTNPQVQTAGDQNIVVRSKEIDETTRSEILAEMEARFENQISIQRFESVDPSVGQEVVQRTAGAVGLAALGILLYITYAFRGVENAFRYGVAAIIAMLHDVILVIGIEAIFGHYLGWEADALFFTALLTIVIFSVHDSIVVFARIRENARIYRRLPYETLVNHSIIQTLDRSINTQLTIMLTLFALTLFGGSTIRHFVVILLIGVFSGTYSSIFNAAPILVVWENKEWKTWFRKKKPSRA